MSRLMTGFRYGRGCWRGGRGQIHVVVDRGHIVTATYYGHGHSQWWHSTETAQRGPDKSALGGKENDNVQSN